MPFHKISRALKLATIRLYEREILPLWDILDIMDLSRRTFFRILKLWRETGDVVTHKYGNLAGRPRILNFDNIYYVLQLVRLLGWRWHLFNILKNLSIVFGSYRVSKVIHCTRHVTGRYKEENCYQSKNTAGRLGLPKVTRSDVRLNLSEIHPQGPNLLNFSHFRNDVSVPTYMKIALNFRRIKQEQR